MVRHVAWTHEGHIEAIKPSSGFLAVLLTVQSCRSWPVNLFYFKLCKASDPGAIRMCSNSTAPGHNDFYCTMARTARNINGNYIPEPQEGRTAPLSLSDCKQAGHHFASEHETYQLMQSCGLVHMWD